MMEIDEIPHNAPAWRDRADFIIAKRVRDPAVRAREEQLWARQISSTRFELCCIPFTDRDVALGDEVEVDPESYLVTGVVRRSGAFTFRVLWPTPPSGDQQAAARDAFAQELAGRGSDVEWYSSRFLAISVPDRVSAELIQAVLDAGERAGEYVYETAWCDVDESPAIG